MMEQDEPIDAIDCLLEPQWIEQHEEKRRALMIVDPWTNKGAIKAGLIPIYIADTITEIIELSIEKNKEHQLGVPNPAYLAFMKLLNGCLTSKTGRDFNKVLAFVKTHLQRDISVYRWNYMPDIRILNTAEECMSWLALFIKGYNPGTMLNSY